MRCIVFLSFLLFACRCSPNSQRKEPSLSSLTLQKQQKIDTTAVFIDSTHIGLLKKSKVFLTGVVIDDSIQKAYLKFYAKRAGQWNLLYSFEDNDWSGHDFTPELQDFNNDDYKDFIYMQGTGGRGGNGIYSLFIYDKKGDSLMYVINSNDYPNLHYNKRTNSINSFILSGGIETDFMRLDNNKLIRFASVFQFGKRVTATEYDNAGNPKIVTVDSSGRFDEYARFINYKPLIVEK